MSGNLLSTVLALLFYLTSGLFGGGSTPSQTAGGYHPGTADNLFPRSAVVHSQSASIRAKPATSGTVVGAVTSGSHLLLLDESNNWYHVQTDNGQDGWIPTWMVSSGSGTSVAYSGNKVIAAYYVENSSNDPVSYRALSQNIATINTLVPFFFSMDQSGNIKSNHNDKPVSLANAAGSRTLALVNNIRNGNFNSSAIHKLLTSSSSRSRAVQGISRMLRENGYRGVNIDFENVPARDRMYVTAFFRELAATLRPQGLLVTASLPAKTTDDRTSSHSGAFDYQALAPYLDQAMIMTYDEHYSGGSAGPVASYSWVERVIKYTMRYFPSSRIILGLAAYGYDWGWGSGKALTYSAIQKLVASHKIAPKWDSNAKVPYFTYKSWGVTHKVWYENARSAAAKVELVNRYGLKGVAVWRLGYEDPEIWTVLRQALR